MGGEIDHEIVHTKGAVMIGSLISLIIYLIVVGLIFWLLYWLIDAVPLPEPFNRFARIALVVLSVLIIILILLNFAGLLDAGMPKLR